MKLSWVTKIFGTADCAVEVVEVEHAGITELIVLAEVARQHHPKPGSAAVAVRGDRIVGALQLAELLFAAVFPLELQLAALRQEKRELVTTKRFSFLMGVCSSACDHHLGLEKRRAW